MSENFLKLTNAVYKVLEFFPESDPLKNRAKDKALAIMEHLVLVNDASGWASFQKEKIKAALSEDIDVLSGYLWIGKTQGWLNSVNYLIIVSEYEKVKKDITPSIELTQKLPGMNGHLEIAPETNSGSVLNDTGAIKEGAPVLFGNTFDNKNLSLAEITERQKKILDFLSQNGKAQVMDLQTVLPDITKRTIRRDLDELLESGKIVRMGDFNEIFYKIKG